MPSVDLPLDNLRDYYGTNPKPSDFNQYWKKALNELENSDMSISMTESNFKAPYAECYDLVFKGVDEKKIYAKLLLPKNIIAPVPAVVEYHGYGGNSRDWSTKLSFVAAGVAVFSMDCRDQFGNTDSEHFRRGNLIRGLDLGAENLYYKKLFLDAAKLAKIVMSMENIDENRVATLGLSQGGALALVAASLEPKVKKVFSIYPFLCDYKRVWEMDLGESPYEELRDYFKYKDPLHEKESYIFTTLGYIDVQYLAPEIKGEVTVVTGLMDKICPASTQFAMYNKIMSKKNMLVYPDFGHEDIVGLSDKVFQWILTI